MLLAPVILIGGYFAFVQIEDHFNAPDIVLIFGNPEEPRFWVQNPSAKLAREATYQLLLFNLSAAGERGWNLNLEIPTADVGFIRPGGARGPWAIRSVVRQGSSIEKGNHLFGYGQVWCPNCANVRFFWLYVHVGSIGWYAEIADDEINIIEETLKAIASGSPNYLTKIGELVPRSRRTSMGRTN